MAQSNKSFPVSIVISHIKSVGRRLRKRKLVYTAEMDTMAVKQKAMSLAKKSYLLVDSSKFGVKGFCSFISTDDFDAIFSDNNINIDVNDIPKNFVLIDTNKAIF